MSGNGSTYFSKENGVYVFLAHDYPKEPQKVINEAFFYDEDQEENYEGFFEYDSHQATVKEGSSFQKRIGKL